MGEQERAPHPMAWGSFVLAIQKVDLIPNEKMPSWPLGLLSRIHHQYFADLIHLISVTVRDIDVPANIVVYAT